MRTIKFRGKANHPESLRYGTFVYGSLITRGDIDPLINTDDNHCPIDVMVDPNTIGQFTGLHDKNGKEIYEGDLLNVCILPFVEPDTVTLKWNENEASYILVIDEKTHSFYRFGDIIESEVIGNIYDTKTEDKK